MKKSNFKLSVFLSLFFFLSIFAPKTLSATQELYFPDEEATISMDFQDANLKDILKIFSIQSGLNFIASEAVQDRKITLYLDKVPIKEAMDKLFKANNLSYELDPESSTLIIKDWGKPAVETMTKVFYLRHAAVSTSSLKEEMSDKLSSQQSSSSGGGIGGGGGGGGSSGGQGKWKVEEDAGITQAIKKILSENGKVIEDFRTNSLIVSDIPSRMPMIEQTIAALDIAVPQVLLEVEMLDVSKNEIDKIGVNWPQTLAGLTMTGSKGTSFPFGTDRGTSPRGWSMGMGNDTITGINGMEWAFSAWDAMKFGPSVFTLIGSTIAFDFLRQLKDTKYLARPRILTLNNESAEIKITTQEAIGQIQTLSSGGSLTTQTTNQAERVETGVTLRVTPQIDLESGEITMLVVSTVKDTNASSFGGAASTTMKDPEERSTKSVVRVKDGETVIIGGLIRNDSSQQVDKLPLLGDIPIIGGAFRYKNKDKDRERELLVFITPHIIKDSAVKKLTQAKKVSLPEREQGTVSVMDRQTVVSATLNSFEQKN